VSAPHEEGILRAVEPVEESQILTMAHEPVDQVLMLVESGPCSLPLEIMEGSDGMITRDVICRLKETATTAVNELQGEAAVDNLMVKISTPSSASYKIRRKAVTLHPGRA
jgi:hypothetical protein